MWILHVAPLKREGVAESTEHVNTQLGRGVLSQDAATCRGRNAGIMASNLQDQPSAATCWPDDGVGTRGWRHYL